MLSLIHISDGERQHQADGRGDDGLHDAPCEHGGVRAQAHDVGHGEMAGFIGEGKVDDDGQRDGHEGHHPDEVRGGPGFLFHRSALRFPLHDVDLVRADAHADELAHLGGLGFQMFSGRVFLCS